MLNKKPLFHHQAKVCGMFTQMSSLYPPVTEVCDKWTAERAEYAVFLCVHKSS